MDALRYILAVPETHIVAALAGFVAGVLVFTALGKVMIK